MRISPIQSRTLRRDREFLTLNLRLRDKTEKKYPPILGIETRSRFIIFILRFRDENENFLDLISVCENSKSCHLSLKSGLNGLTILHAISGRLTIVSLSDLNERNSLLRYTPMLIMLSGCSTSPSLR